MDELGGSTVRFTDIRYARNGIEVRGMPAHSPLITEASEASTSNDFLANAVALGALGFTDRAALGIAGAIGKQSIVLTDVDFYEFQANGFTSFDLDYSNGIRAENLTFWVFTANGQVVLQGTNSNIHDDRPGPFGGTNLTDLSRGTVGSGDPFVGNAFLPAGTYYVAVSGSAAPAAISGNPLLRFEPIRSTQRLVEDHIGSIGGSVDEDPVFDAMITPESFVPWNLGDVTLWIAEEEGAGFETTRVTTHDPFTGEFETLYGSMPGGTFNFDVGDLVMRGADDQLYALRTDLDDPANGPDDAESGNLLQINSATGAATIIGDDEIITYELDNTGAIIQGHLFAGAGIGWGVQFNAMAYMTTAAGEILYAIGNRGDNGLPTFGPNIKQNIMYALLPNNGLGVDNPGVERIDGAATDVIEIGEVLVSPRITAPDATVTRPNLNAPFEPPIITEYTRSLQDGQTFLVSDGPITDSFEFDIGYEIRQTIDRVPPTLSVVRDGDFFTLDNNVFQFNTGKVIEVNIPGGNQFADGIVVTVQGIDPATGFATAKSFEYNYAVVPTGGTAPPPYDVTATQMDYSQGTTTLQLAQLLADAINGEATIGVAASAVGTRISLQGELAVQVSFNNPVAVPSSWVTLTGDTNTAPVMHVVDPALINDGDTFTMSTGFGATAQQINFEFDRDNALNDPAARRVNIATATTANQVIQAINAAVNASSARNISSVSEVGNTVTVTTPTTHNFATGQLVSITGVGNSIYNGVFTITGTPTANSFTYAHPIAGLTPSGGGTAELAGARLTARMQSIPPAPLAGLGDKISINGDNIQFVNYTGSTAGFANITIPGQNLIGVEESFTDDAIGLATRNQINANYAPLYDVGSDTARINVHGADTIDVTAVPAWSLYNRANPGVASVNFPIEFNAEDDPAALAQKIAAAINAAYANPGGTPANSATATGNFVRLDHGEATAVVLDPAALFRMTIEGQGPGGVVTGSAVVNGQMFAVTDRGGLHRINPSIPGAFPTITTTYVQSSRDDLEGINFQGLTAAPDGVEGGRYINTMFGISENGRMYAFDTNGVLQPIMVNGATSVDTGRTNVRGLAFANLDRSLWTTIGDRGLDAGHGLDAVFDWTWDGNRLLPTPGGTSVHFGQGILSNYNFSGGAYGTVVTSEFSLKGYSALDLPTLYFNYFNASDGALDAFKVFIADNSGNWQQLSTAAVSNGGWLQVRVGLGGFAGDENLRLRFDFSTAGEMNVGHTNTTGDELRAVAARYMQDGDIVTLDNFRTFEFEMGQTIVPPSGAGVYDRQSLTLQINTNPPNQLPNFVNRVFEFDSGNGRSIPASILVPFNALMTSEDVAQSLQSAIDGAALAGVTTHRLDNRLNVKGLSADIIDTMPAGLPFGAFSAVDIQGSVGINDPINDATNILVDIDLLMNRTEVATALDAEIEQVYAQQTFRFNDGSNYSDGQIFDLVDDRDPVNPVTYSFEIDTGFILQVPSGGMDPIAGLSDGDTFTVSNGATTVIYEFDTDQVPSFIQTNTRRRVAVPPGSTMPTVAQAIAAAIDNTPAVTRTPLGLDGTAIGAGRVQLNGATLPVGGPHTLTITTANAGVMTQFGSPGVFAGNSRIYVSPSVGFKAAQVAQNARAAMAATALSVIPGYTFTVNASDQARIIVTKDDVTFPDLRLVANDPTSIRFRDGSRYTDGQTFSVVDVSGPVPVTHTFEFDSGYVLQVPLFGMSPVGGLNDGDFFTLTDGTNQIRYEFDSNNSVAQTANLRAVNVNIDSPTTTASTQAQVAQSIAFAINNTPGALPLAWSLQATLLGNGRVQLNGAPAASPTLNVPITISNPNLTQSGVPGVAPGNNRVYFKPFATYTAAQLVSNPGVADVVGAFNSIPALNVRYTAVVDPAEPARINIVKVNPNNPDLIVNAVGVADVIAITEVLYNNISKQHEDLLRIIGHQVTTRGSLGLDTALAGDLTPNDPVFAPVGFHDELRSANNAFEGVYFDDIMIGFAERGELITNAGANASFNLPAANQTDGERVAGVDQFALTPYQLEVRYGEETGTGEVETNDRLVQAYQITGQPGADLVDGQSFRVGDGVNSVRFEFNDSSILPASGVTAGSIRIDFDPQDEDWEVAARIRDAINSSSVRNLLPSISASLADGTHTGVNSNNVSVNLLGPASATVQGGAIQIVDDQPSANALRDYLIGAGITPVGQATLIRGPNSAGIFQNGFTFGLDNGIILSTGDVNDAEPPNNSPGQSGAASGLSDAQLNAEFGLIPGPFSGTQDTTSLEFQFVHPGGDLKFDFAFASEEYSEFVFTAFNDVFAFFVDGVNVALVPNSTTPVSIDTINDVVNDEFYVSNEFGQFRSGTQYDGFTEVLSAIRRNLPAGTHTIRIAIADVGDSLYDSAVLLGANSLQAVPGGAAVAAAPPENIPGVVFDSESDDNRFRDQGQILIHSNTIRDSLQFGINIDAGQRYRPELGPQMGSLPHAGAARVLRDTNNERLAPGVVVMNNILDSGRSGGIHISGDSQNAGGAQQGILPYARIVNNTIWGTGAGVGIEVQDFAAPTLLNNIVGNNAIGVSVDLSSSPTFVNGIQQDRTILSGMLYQLNGAATAGPVGVGDFALLLAPNDPLFVDAANHNFYLEFGSAAIDSSVQLQQDRANLVSLRSPLGIDPSPILAPIYDISGQLRVDDPDATPPFGLGGTNVFVDRGAVDRVDVVGPTAQLIVPLDNGVGDTNPLATEVTTNSTTLTSFRIQLNDGVQPADPVNGTGVDDSTVDFSKLITFTRDLTPLTAGGATPLVRGIDYTFAYDATNNTIILTPLTGIWVSNATYVIELDNTPVTGILDLAQNPLKPNQLPLTGQTRGATRFTINVGTIGGGGPPTPTNVDFGDAAEPRWATSIVSNGARHTIQPGFALGARVDAESNGQPTATGLGDDNSPIAGLDDEDGISFVTGTDLIRGRTLQYTVIATGDGVLDAWIDFNGDGDWLDTGERIASGVPLATGVSRTLNFDVPGTATNGDTFARFRLTRSGISLPTGAAPDGEVEDYLVTIKQNPWVNPNYDPTTNPTARFDVSGDGFVSAIDALLVINRLNFSGPQNPLPPVPGPGEAPPYFDVNNDGALGPQDALDVIVFLNTRGQPEGEAASSSIDVNPSASVGGNSPAQAAAGSVSTDSASLPPLGDDTAPKSVAGPAKASEANADDIYSPADEPKLPPLYLNDNSDDDDDLDSILAGGDGTEEADDFFGWFGQ